MNTTLFSIFNSYDNYNFYFDADNGLRTRLILPLMNQRTPWKCLLGPHLKSLLGFGRDWNQQPPTIQADALAQSPLGVSGRVWRFWTNWKQPHMFKSEWDQLNFVKLMLHYFCCYKSAVWWCVTKAGNLSENIDDVIITVDIQILFSNLNYLIWKGCSLFLQIVCSFVF